MSPTYNDEGTIRCDWCDEKVEDCWCANIADPITGLGEDAESTGEVGAIVTIDDETSEEGLHVERV